MAKEREALNSTCFKRLIEFSTQTERDGVPANGNKVAIPTQKDGLVRCGDLSFQQKMSSLGVTCKSMKIFGT